MEILVASEADIKELTEVEIESKLQSYPNLMEDVDINPAIRLRRWQTYFAGQSPVSAKPERIVFKAMADHKIVGYIAAHLTTRFDVDAEIQSFYILMDHQRKGLGTKLLNEVVSWLNQLNVQSLCVGISPHNPYQAFYPKHRGEYLNPHWIVLKACKILCYYFIRL